MTNDNRIAIAQTLHAATIAVGATFLAIGFVFYGLEFSYIMALMGDFTKDEIIRMSGGTFVKLFIIYTCIGTAIIVVSTILTIIFIKRNDSPTNPN